MYVSNESLTFWTRTNPSDLKMAKLLSWVFEKGTEICCEVLFLFSALPNVKLIVPKQNHKSEGNLHPPLPYSLRETQRDAEVSKPHSLEKLSVYYMNAAEV